MPIHEPIHGPIGAAVYHLESEIGELCSSGAYTKNVTLGTWDPYPNVLKLDIRTWRNGCEYKSGISLTEHEVKVLRRLLDKIDFGK